MHSKRFKALQCNPSAARPVEDSLPIEAVLQLKINTVPYTTTVRTPGADEALARGLMYTEGVVVDETVHPQFRHIVDPDTGLTGCLEIAVPDSALAKEVRDRRSSMGSASCGFCGTREPEELAMSGSALRVEAAQRMTHDAISRQAGLLSSRQPLFDETGGVHCAMAMDLGGNVLSAHEDIGRHNGVDKVIGALLIRESLREATGVFVSGRLSYEIVFKAFRARWPYLMSVSAPSSLAVEMGERFGMCIIGFCRENRYTVYSHPELLVD